MKAVLLAGGLGTRMREETEFRPKPMVAVGGKPVIWHVMKMLSQQGIKEFVICAGYKSDQIKNYFLNYDSHNSDFTVSLGSNDGTVFHGIHDEAEWIVTVAETGPFTNTGGRIKRIQKYVEDGPFLATYGDGLANLDLNALVEFHKSSKRLATVSTTQTTSRFGTVSLGPHGGVSGFLEKPKLNDWISIGFFIFETQVFSYLDDDSVLENEPLKELAELGQLGGFRHTGFWQPMDTFRESQILNDLWDSGEAPWKNWD